MKFRIKKLRRIDPLCIAIYICGIAGVLVYIFSNLPPAAVC